MIVKALDLSTAHLTREDAKLLENQHCFDDHGPRYSSHEYGWTFFIAFDGHNPEDAKEAGMSDAFVNILKYAIKKKCWFVNFDQAGEEDPNLPTFEW